MNLNILRAGVRKVTTTTVGQIATPNHKKELAHVVSHGSASWNTSCCNNIEQ